MLVEALVDGGGVEAHVRMGLLDRGDALGRRDQHQGADFLGPGLLQQIDGGDQGAAGGQHGIDDHGQALVQFTHQLFQVGVGLQGGFVAGEADHADPGAGDQAEHAVEHADAGAQDGHHGDLLAGDLFHLDGAAPALDVHLFHR